MTPGLVRTLENLLELFSFCFRERYRLACSLGAKFSISSMFVVARKTDSFSSCGCM